MRQIVMLDDGLRILEEGIVRAKHILIGHPPKTLFTGQLYERYKMALEESIVSVIKQERNGKQVQDLLKNVLNFFLEIGEGKIDYHIAFELLMLEEAASYYSQLALELLCCISYADYIQKVVWFLIQEQEKAGQYLKQASLEKLLEFVKWKLMGETAQVLIQKQKTES
ncbi:cullin-1-like isoform X3 [Quercus robur]|uniref:cullin-1-like isoform X3 n=1 Tax=Quercus robur TaxID=38942 RepID=UPI0021634C20|nr:cullin-1-like isoform X3 [Quercus robur]